MPVRRRLWESRERIAIGMVKRLIAEEARDPKDVEIETLRKFKANKEASDAASA